MNSRSYYQQVTPADGWAYIQTTGQDHAQVIVLPVTAWAFTGNRKVIGLIAQPESSARSKVAGIVCTPLEPPVLPGEYKPISELNQAEVASLKTGKPVPASRSTLSQHFEVAAAPQFLSSS